ITTRDRIDLLVQEKDTLSPWIGDFDAAALENLLETQLGSARALDEWLPRGDTRSRAVPLSPLLHIISGNTPHAAFQSIIRGLLIGAQNRVKLPSAGLPEFEQWLAQLPAELVTLIDARHDLPESWLDSAGAVI